MAKTAKRAKKAKAAPRKAKAAKARAVKKAGVEPVAAMLRAKPGAAHPDRRLPIWDDDQHEILCKWIDADNGYRCKEVTIGGDWPRQ